MDRLEQHFYHFEGFCVDTLKRLLLRDGNPIPLTPKAFDTLLVLVENRGRILAKEELMRAIWQENVVEENNLSQSISSIRKALGESPEAHQFILTVPGKGYSFVSNVSELSYEEQSPHQTMGKVIGKQKTIAILPFRTLGTDGAEYLGPGISEALITRLGKTNQIAVRSTNARAIGRKLRVETVLDGSIQKHGDRIRVTVQLLRVSDGTTLWAEKFDEKSTDIFAVEDRVSAQVASALTVRLTGEEKDRLTKHYTESSAAYEAYLKGRYFWNKRNEEGLKKGIAYFSQAIEIDPRYGLAYTGLADSYSMLGILGYVPAKHSFPKAREAAIKALHIDSALAEAHASMALVKLDYEWDWPGARTEFEAAVTLNPNYATARQWYAECLLVSDGPEAALREARLAHELDPLSLTINRTLGEILYFARKYEEAIEQLKKTLEMDPNFPMVKFYLRLAYAQKSPTDQSLPISLEALPVDGDDAWNLASLGYAYAAYGQRPQAENMIRQLEKINRRRFVPAGLFGFVYAGLRDEDRVLECLEKSHEERFTLWVFSKVDPCWDPFRSSPRFARLIEGLDSRIRRD
jgi:DNA-binding winged helix-turn-helix (wHTH) protein